MVHTVYQHIVQMIPIGGGPKRYLPRLVLPPHPDPQYLHYSVFILVISIYLVFFLDQYVTIINPI